MVDMFQLLLILYCICSTIESFYAVTLCEKKFVNVSCDNGTEIEIQDIQFGPLSSDYGEHQESGRMPTLNKTEFETACNNRSYCYLNSTEFYQFAEYQYIERLKKYAYKCDFEYLGCYKDNSARLFTGPGVKYRTGLSERDKNMSALICRNFCSSQTGHFPYFGTENSFECYCGFENDTMKLNTTLDGVSYNWHKTLDCSSNCAKHTYEKCGKDGLISTYTTITDPINDRTQTLAPKHLSLTSNFTDGTIGIVSGVILVLGIVITFHLVKRHRSTLKRKASESPGTPTDRRFDQQIVEYENVTRHTHVHSDKNDHEKNLTYSAVIKQKGTKSISTLGQENNTFSSPEDVYVETAEGVYDISYKPRDKNGSSSQAIYSHTTEDVYDSSTSHAQFEENAYDEGFHR